MTNQNATRRRTYSQNMPEVDFSVSPPKKTITLQFSDGSSWHTPDGLDCNLSTVIASMTAATSEVTKSCESSQSLDISTKVDS